MNDANTRDLSEEVFDDYGKPVTSEERPFYRPEEREERNSRLPDKNDIISSILSRLEERRAGGSFLPGGTIITYARLCLTGDEMSLDPIRDGRRDDISRVVQFGPGRR